eukprot:6193911-Pleurochrysis_carterae.AAC.6
MYADIFHAMRLCDPVVHMLVLIIRLAFADVLAARAQFSYHRNFTVSRVWSGRLIAQAGVCACWYAECFCMPAQAVQQCTGCDLRAAVSIGIVLTQHDARLYRANHNCIIMFLVQLLPQLYKTDFSCLGSLKPFLAM